MRRRIAAVIGGLSVAAAVAAFLLMRPAPSQPLETRPPSAVIGTRLERAVTLSTPRQVLRDLGLPERTEAVGPIDGRGMDGTAPEMHGAVLRSLQSLDRLRAYYRTACHAQDLMIRTSPLEPDQICDDPKRRLQVLLTPCVDPTECTAYLEVRGF
jgi:hypothetical protein